MGAIRDRRESAIFCTSVPIQGSSSTWKGGSDAVSTRSVEQGDGVMSQLESDWRVDCIVSEVVLPDQRGLDLLERVRERYDGLPFILLARDGHVDAAAAAVNVGADGFIQCEPETDRPYPGLREQVESSVAAYRAQRAQAETRRRLLQLAESSNSAVWLFTPDWSEALYVNSTYEDLWGRPIERLKEDPTDFLQGVHPDDRTRVMEAMETLSNGESVELEYWVNPKEDYQRRVVVEGEPVYDQSGNLAYMAGFAYDITERRKREAELERRNEELEVFNSLLRHDVLNGLTVIRTRADILAEELEGEQRQFAETIVKWSDNITGLVGRIRTVLATLVGEETELERVNLSRVLREQIDTINSAYPAVEFDSDVPDDVFVVANDLLADVFKNIITNAVEHNDPERLRVKTTVSVDVDTVTVTIADNGTGIRDEIKDEIFRRGRTGHVKRTGSGFGLFFVDGMVTAYGGSVRVEDNDQGGATFVIELTPAHGD